MSKTHIVWFKRDLRVHDHAPLAAACASGDPVLALYVFEPEVWLSPDGTARQLHFLRDALGELKEALDERGAQLVIRIGSTQDVFAQLHRDHGISAIHTYQDSQSETERKRDSEVRRWALRAGVSIREQETSLLLGVSGTESQWRARWQAHMNAPRRLAPEFVFSASARSEDIQSLGAGYLQESDEDPGLPGGRTHAVRLLRRAFVAGDPHTFRDVLRALKLHISFGTISVREAVQAALRAKRIGAPGESITYAETLIERLRETCKRQHRLAHRTQGRAGPPNQVIHAPLANRHRRERAQGTQLQRRTRPSLAQDQLSFDFPGSFTAPPRQAS